MHDGIETCAASTIPKRRVAAWGRPLRGDTRKWDDSVVDCANEIPLPRPSGPTMPFRPTRPAPLPTPQPPRRLRPRCRRGRKPLPSQIRSRPSRGRMARLSPLDVRGRSLLSPYSLQPALRKPRAAQIPRSRASGCASGFEHSRPRSRATWPAVVPLVCRPPAASPYRDRCAATWKPARKLERFEPGNPSSPRLSGYEGAAKTLPCCGEGASRRSSPWQDALRGCRPSEARRPSGTAETSRARPVPPARCCRRRVRPARR